MTGKELLKWQLEHTGKQLDKAIGDMDESKWDHKSSPGIMSPREQVEHLGETYAAYSAMAKGEKYEWGTFVVDDKSKANLWKTYSQMRERAVSAAIASDEPKDLESATEYLLTHEAYHVGQLCSLRLDCEPSWDPYAIYAE